MQANLTDFAKLMSAWLCSLSQIVILWQHEFYQLALEDFKEWTIACKYAQSQDFLEDAVPFEDFLDYLINNCQNMDRQRYFLDNRYNLKIFTARIGGFSILHWLEMVYFRDKTKVVAYKYGGKMTMLGYMTNIVKNDVICDDSNVFRTFPTLINTFMLGFFNKNEIKIIHPVAIYY